MFPGILPIILLVFLIGAAALINTSPLFPDSPETAFLTLTAAIALFFLLLFIQAKSKWARNFGKDRFSLVADIELILLFSFFIFFTGSHRVFFLWFENFGKTACAVAVLSFSFICKFFAVYWLENTWKGNKWAKREAGANVRFLLPFTLPFIALILLNDIFDSTLKIDMISGVKPPYNFILYFSAAAFAASLLILIQPRLAVKIWGSPPLQDKELLAKMESLCAKAGFTQSGINEWPVKNLSLNAAIIGIASCSRFILFSPKLLEVASHNAACAILAHEIGHWRHRHLMIYPFIIFEIIALSLLSTTFLFDPLLQYFSLAMPANQEPLTGALIYAATFGAMAIFMWIYIRLIFGYFSRLFERQADLYPLSLGIPADHVIEALDTLATAAGNIHNAPSWHHFSIRQRIDFLEAAKTHPEKIENHRRKVTFSLIIFFMIFAATMYFMFSLYP